MAPALVRAQVLAQALQQVQLAQVQLAQVQVHLVEVDILEALDNPAADKVDTVDSPAAGMDTRQVVPVEGAVRIVGPLRLAVPLEAVVDLRQASDAMCSHNSNI